MKYTVIIEKGDNSFGAYIPDLPGCAVVSETEEETMELLKEAVQMHIEAQFEDGKELHVSKERDTAYLESIPDMVDSIVAASKEDLQDCSKNIQL